MKVEERKTSGKERVTKNAPALSHFQSSPGGNYVNVNARGKTSRGKYGRISCWCRCPVIAEGYSGTEKCRALLEFRAAVLCARERLKKLPRLFKRHIKGSSFTERAVRHRTTFGLTPGVRRRNSRMNKIDCMSSESLREICHSERGRFSLNFPQFRKWISTRVLGSAGN